MAAAKPARKTKEKLEGRFNDGNENRDDHFRTFVGFADERAGLVGNDPSRCDWRNRNAVGLPPTLRLNVLSPAGGQSAQDIRIERATAANDLCSHGFSGSRRAILLRILAGSTRDRRSPANALQSLWNRHWRRRSVSKARRLAGVLDQSIAWCWTS